MWNNNNNDASKIAPPGTGGSTIPPLHATQPSYIVLAPQTIPQEVESKL
ncbi:pre-mRNA-processing-splicing factor 8-like protein [Corchorus olitorius]|uniref:Pre-mRNA-processing-splicing factor 8-like isoform 1 n=1 Tax=Corchorus olitorius TaxID=93759 RepID=A0A1R3JYH3_9ROSI|nr:pre-mRNA-processing-splicing factor 8-like isoform 1 [Corchorus olitorius]OMP12652.1 pre-mRNA-processing-splicing factor 8-like protein [Corchorus olitorius]